jgi:hypothetical protein
VIISARAAGSRASLSRQSAPAVGGLMPSPRKLSSDQPMANETKKLCFVIGPIGDAGTETRTHADWLLDGIIRPVFVEHFPEFGVLRADEIRAPGDINSQIIQRLMDAELVIADMSLHNANAFYELAVRHMVRLPTIHIIHKDWKIPFDVAPYRAIHFSRQEFGDLNAARDELASVVQEVITPGFQVENPITHARARFELDQHATPAMKALADEVATITAKLNDLQMQIVVNHQMAQARSSVPPMGSLYGSGPTTPSMLAAAEEPYLNRGILSGISPLHLQKKSNANE